MIYDSTNVELYDRGRIFRTSLFRQVVFDEGKQSSRESVGRLQNFNKGHVASINSISNFDGIMPSNLKPICDYNIQAASESPCGYFNFFELIYIIRYRSVQVNR